MLASKATRTNFSPLKGAYCAQEWHNSILLLSCLVYHLRWRQSGAASNLHDSSSLKPQLKAASFHPTGLWTLLSVWLLPMHVHDQSELCAVLVLASCPGGKRGRILCLAFIKKSEVKIGIYFRVANIYFQLLFLSTLTLFWFSLSTEFVSLSKNLNPAKPGNQNIWKEYPISPGWICSSRLWLRSAWVTL